jgi:hypothetical protein
MEENMLYIDEEEDDDANVEDEYETDEAIEQDGFPGDEIDYDIGPHGEIYPSSSSGEEMIEDD